MLDVCFPWTQLTCSDICLETFITRGPFNTRKTKKKHHKHLEMYKHWQRKFGTPPQNISEFFSSLETVTHKLKAHMSTPCYYLESV